MASKMEIIARAIYDFCKQHDLWEDNTIYFDGVAWSNLPEWGGESGTKIDDDLYLYENKNPRDYFEYANPETLSMSFEGSLCYLLNYYVHYENGLDKKFEQLLASFGYYYELGNSWNMSIYEI